MKETTEYLVDDTPLNFSVYENLSDEEFAKVVAKMEDRHNEIIKERTKSEEYTVPNALIQKDEIDIAIKHFINLGFTIETATEKAYKTLSDKYHFSLEVLKNEREN